LGSGFRGNCVFSCAADDGVRLGARGGLDRLVRWSRGPDLVSLAITGDSWWEAAYDVPWSRLEIGNNPASGPR
jgi:hypothetical protein